jgi:hypothetical protein
MNWTRRRIAVGVVDAFAAVSAIAGGWAVMTGAVRPGVNLAHGPLSWLINDYFVAGELLVVVTGGSALAALIATLIKPRASAGFSAAAGLVMMGWIVSEVILIGSNWLQAVYFVVGLAMVVLAARSDLDDLRAAAHRLHLA